LCVIVFCSFKFHFSFFFYVYYLPEFLFSLFAVTRIVRTFVHSEIMGAPVVVIEEEPASASAASAGASASEPQSRVLLPVLTEDDMTAIQRKRFNHFKQMRIFITNMTNICERLRLVNSFICLLCVSFDIIYEDFLFCVDHKCKSFV
jgi:hypothetical protein